MVTVVVQVIRRNARTLTEERKIEDCRSKQLGSQGRKDGLRIPSNAKLGLRLKRHR